jgi:hypothetical protein
VTLPIMYVVCGLMQMPSHDMREADDVLLPKSHKLFVDIGDRPFDPLAVV